MRPDGAVELFDRFVRPDEHANSDYFGLIKALVQRRNDMTITTTTVNLWDAEIAAAYNLVADELLTNQGAPTGAVNFGTSGWRGVLGKDLFVKSVAQVTMAVVDLYKSLEESDELGHDLGVASLAEARRRGGVVGHDNRFGGELLAGVVRDILTANGFVVHYAGESSTGALSAAVLELGAAFSINLTPSHNPLEYGGFKFNAADAGPAASTITSRITSNTRRIMAEGVPLPAHPDASLVRDCDALGCWKGLVRKGVTRHGFDYDGILDRLRSKQDLAMVVDCVHGASRVHIRRLLKDVPDARLVVLRENDDPTFGGIAPEPSTANLKAVVSLLRQRSEPLKLGVILDPDADRIRFTDGNREITMNHFGAMAYHFMHQIKGRKGLVAKTVATSNLANQLASAFGEEVFEPRVGFKEFKPVINEALVCFEESDGITVLGHTPEKDAYIGLIIAVDMVLSLNKNLGDYLAEIEEAYGLFCPTKGGVEVSKQGAELKEILSRLDSYQPGQTLLVNGKAVAIAKVINIDGYKMVLEDGSWLMIRPSGTEPKVRFYVEARSVAGQAALLETASTMLAEMGLLG